MRSVTRCALFAVSILASVVSVASPRTVPSAPVLYSCTFFYELLAYAHKPDLRKFGIQPARVFGPQDLWRKGSTREAVPSEIEVARGLALRPPNGGPIVLDIEHWPQRGTDVEVASSVERLIGLFDRAKGLESKVNVGYYGVPPIRDYWRAIRQPGSPLYLEWQHDNDRLQALADKVDILFPSLYTFYDDVDGWQRYAIANLEEARRLAGSRPIYAFLWPQFHESNKKLALQYLDAGFWRTELEVVAAHADGIVLWGGWEAAGKRAEWDESAPWWIETKRFIEGRSGDKCRPAR